MLLHRFDVQSVVSNYTRCQTLSPTSETPCLSGGRSSCPGCGGTRAAGCVLLGCGQTGGTLWSQSSGCLRSAGFTHSDWQQQQHYTSAVPVNSWTRLIHGSFHLCEHGYWHGCLDLWKPVPNPQSADTEEVGESKDRWYTLEIEKWGGGSALREILGQ